MERRIEEQSGRQLFKFFGASKMMSKNLKNFRQGDVVSIGRWMAKLVARLLATAALWVPIQISLKNTKWAT
jgi:hypothetical protein